MMESCDVAIVGAGLVGASLAAALADTGLSIVLVEPRMPAVPGADWDSRIYAISPGSAAFLAQAGVWQAIDERRIERVEAMHIVGDDSSVRLEFSAYDAGVRELALIVESGRLQSALWQRVSNGAQVKLACPAVCAALRFDADCAVLSFAGGTALRAKLVVGADGAQSWVREQAGVKAAVSDYAQSGVVANFTCTLPHRGTAYQWFRADGVLALLPLPGNRASMVWSTHEAHAQELLALAGDVLAQRVTEASGGVLGELQLITAAAAFPLCLQRVDPLVKPRMALVGDAAHGIHPLAGQGVNLGFRDARDLASVLRDRGAQTDCGDYALLRRYERARKEDVLTMQLVTDGLQKLFASRAVWWSRTRNWGMGLLNEVPPLKHLLVKHAVA